MKPSSIKKEDVFVIVGSCFNVVAIILHKDMGIRFALFFSGIFFSVLGFLIMLKGKRKV